MFLVREFDDIIGCRRLQFGLDSLSWDLLDAFACLVGFIKAVGSENKYGYQNNNDFGLGSGFLGPMLP